MRIDAGLNMDLDLTPLLQLVRASCSFRKGEEGANVCALQYGEDIMAH